ncbi:MAG: peptide chain release factor N(5)-glutamine methyltransferase [Cyclobacteriaceae bacterium]
MTNSNTLFQQLQKKITLNEEDGEIKSILYLLFEKEFGLSRAEILTAKEIESIDEAQLEKYVERINHHEPIQYILGEAYFFGRKFQVNPSVLIPRPETELIVSLMKDEKFLAPSVLDIGTGSGCIAISLALEISAATVHALDVSKQALSIARENAKRLNTSINFLQHDILNQTPPLTNLDVIVSNPPYVTEKEKGAMNKNVLNHEPHLALFVADNDPLKFYKVIAEKSLSLLKFQGKVFVEINQLFGKEVVAIFSAFGYRTEIIKDIEGKDRVVRGVRT